MKIRHPDRVISLLLLAILAVQLLALRTGETLALVVGMFAQWVCGFVVAIVLVLRKGFWVEAIDRNGETWTLEWRRAD